jgi:hypothetical protein
MTNRRFAALEEVGEARGDIAANQPGSRSMKLKLEVALQKEQSTTRSFSSLASLLVELKHNQSAQEHPKLGE